VISSLRSIYLNRVILVSSDSDGLAEGDHSVSREHSPMMDTPPSISVVIPAFDRTELLG
jgi:hypothetical protein